MRDKRRALGSWALMDMVVSVLIGKQEAAYTEGVSVK